MQPYSLRELRAPAPSEPSFGIWPNDRDESMTSVILPWCHPHSAQAPSLSAFRLRRDRPRASV